MIIVERLSFDQASVKKKVDELLSTAAQTDCPAMKATITVLVDLVASFENRCKVILLKDGLKDWYCSLDMTKTPCT